MVQAVIGRETTSVPGIMISSEVSLMHKSKRTHAARMFSAPECLSFNHLHQAFTQHKAGREKPRGKTSHVKVEMDLKQTALYPLYIQICMLQSHITNQIR